jgi:hypothetical protein
MLLPSLCLLVTVTASGETYKARPCERRGETVIGIREGMETQKSEGIANARKKFCHKYIGSRGSWSWNDILYRHTA